MGLEEVRLASGNPRDKFSFNERKKAWEQLEKAHRYNQGRFPNRPWGMDFYAGDMGRGKTLSCSREATAYYACGWEVYHAGSLLFGRMLQGTEVYTFPQQVEECIVVYFDEPQVWFESNVPQTIANRSVRQVVTTLRKMRCKMIFSTADEGGLLPIFRRETRTVYYPDRYYPGQQQRSRLDLEEEPRRLRYPPWCYVQLTPIGPHPWRRYTLADEYGVYGRRAASRKRKTIKIPPGTTGSPPNSTTALSVCRWPLECASPGQWCGAPWRTSISSATATTNPKRAWWRQASGPRRRTRPFRWNRVPSWCMWGHTKSKNRCSWIG